MTSFLHNDTSLMYIPLTNDDWGSFYIILYHPSSRGIPNKPPLFGWFIVYSIGFTTWKTWSTWWKKWHWIYHMKNLIMMTFWYFFWFQWLGFSCEDWSGMNGRSWVPNIVLGFPSSWYPFIAGWFMMNNSIFWMTWGYIHLPSGKHTKSYWKWP